MTTSVFAKSLPVTLTSFINKSGSIGLSIIPIILVERQISTETSAWIMGSIKSAALVGVLIGGWSCDRFGLRNTILLSFVIAGVSFLPIPFVTSALALGIFGFLAQLGTSFYYTSARLLLTQVVPPGQRKEAIAWQRTAHNFAQILSFSTGSFLGQLGTTLLILFDSATSFVAAAVGAKILPAPRATHLSDSSKGHSSKNIRHFFQVALIIAVFSFLYELFMVAAAARCRVQFGKDGLVVFSQMMIINTILCAGFSVIATRYLENPKRVLPIGIFLLSFGLSLAFGSSQSKMFFFLGCFVLTLGEIAFNSLSSLVLIELTPNSKRQGFIYSLGILVQFLGRISGAALAFPLIVDSGVDSRLPLATVWTASFAGLSLCWISRGVLKIKSSNPVVLEGSPVQ